LKPVKKLPRPVSLKTIKGDERLSNMDLLRLSRLSVVPVKDDEWNVIITLAGN
jgi:predicted RNA-binding protein with PUA-like domain